MPREIGTLSPAWRNCPRQALRNTWPTGGIPRQIRVRLRRGNGGSLARRLVALCHRADHLFLLRFRAWAHMAFRKTQMPSGFHVARVEHQGPLEEKSRFQISLRRI